MPLDSKEHKDSDGDGVGDNSETILTNMNTFLPPFIASVLLIGLALFANSKRSRKSSPANEELSFDNDYDDL